MSIAHRRQLSDASPGRKSNGKQREVTHASKSSAINQGKSRCNLLACHGEGRMHAHAWATLCKVNRVHGDDPPGSGIAIEATEYRQALIMRCWRNSAAIAAYRCPCLSKSRYQCSITVEIASSSLQRGAKLSNGPFIGCLRLLTARTSRFRGKPGGNALFKRTKPVWNSLEHPGILIHLGTCPKYN